MDKETEYLEKLQSGDIDAFGKVFKHYYPRLKAYAATIIDEETAEDIIQDVFLYVWEHKENILPDGGFQSYLYKLVHSRCIDNVRKKSLSDRYMASVCEEYDDIYTKFILEEGDILETIYQKDFYELLHKLLKQIPNIRREIFFMAYIEGMRAKEISQKVKIPIRTVESHIYLAVKFLKGKMRHNNF